MAAITKVTVTFERVSNGEFFSYADGVKTPYTIINGSHGAPGVSNVYGITRDMKSAKWIGTLQACKKIVQFTVNDKLKRGLPL